MCAVCSPPGAAPRGLKESVDCSSPAGTAARLAVEMGHGSKKCLRDQSDPAWNFYPDFFLA
jgi:hypothetical protein